MQLATCWRVNMLIFLKKVVKFIKIFLTTKKIAIKLSANFSYRTKFLGYNAIGQRSWIDGEIGFGSYIGDDCVIEAKIGKFCSISHKVAIVSGNHPTNTFVSTSPSFYSIDKKNGLTYVTEQRFEEKKYADRADKHSVIIGNDVWIGYGAIIMGGVTIGDGSIIGAGAIVKNNVGPYEIVAGVPAKVLRKRFSDKDIEWLLKLKWWDKTDTWLKNNAIFFNDIEILKKMSGE